MDIAVLAGLAQHCRMAIFPSLRSHGLNVTPLVRRHTHFALSAVCLLVGAFTTHGLAGRMRHAPLMQDLAQEASDKAQSWRFWQPFK